VDNDCDYQFDEDEECSACEDNDSDGYYSISTDCTTGNDCNDYDPEVYPGASELCDGKDNNCDSVVDEWCLENKEGKTPNCTPMGSSANLGSGNLFYSYPVFKNIKSQYLPDVTLYYNSIDESTGPLGKGWTHSYNISITEGPGSSLTLMEKDGRRIIFELSGGIYYSRPSSGERSTIIKNPDDTYSLTTQEGITYQFNSSGQLTSIIDRNDYAFTLSYTDSNLTSVTDPVGRVTSFTYTNGKLTEIRDPKERTTVIDYDEVTGYLITITDPENNSWEFTYYSDEKLWTVTDSEDNTTTYGYTGGKVTSSTNASGAKTIAFYPAENKAVIAERDQGVWTYEYDPVLNVPTKIIDPYGGETRYKYNNNRELEWEEYPRDHRISYDYEYYTNGKVKYLYVTDPESHTTTYGYNQFSQITSIEDPEGNTTEFKYDDRGNLRFKKDPPIDPTDPTNRPFTEYKYDPDDPRKLIEIVDPLGHSTTFTYDDYENLASITFQPTGATTTFVPDMLGNITKQTDALGRVTEFEYNDIDQLTKITQIITKKKSYVTEHTPDFRGNPISIKDGNGNITEYEYNHNGQLKKVTQYVGTKIYETFYTYGEASCACAGVDKLNSIEDANHHVTTFEYDLLGRLNKEMDPLGNTIEYTYYPDSDLWTKTDGNGNTIEYGYNNVGQLTRKTYIGLPELTETFEYWPTGRLKSAENQNIRYDFTYHPVGWLKTVTDSQGRTINYEYDLGGNRTKMTTPESKIIDYTYTYNPVDHLRKTQILSDIGTFKLIYNATGKRTKRVYPSKVKTFYTYNKIDFLREVITKNSSGIVLDRYVYTFDKVGNRKTKKIKGDKKYNYTYDDIYRLIKVKLTKGTTTTVKEKYTYDPVGNRLIDKAGNVYGYNDAYELVSYNGTSFSYDNNGNRISKTDSTGTTNYTYDYENRLTRVDLPDGSWTEYKYDPLGRRIEKNVNGTTTKYVYDNEDIILEYNGSNQIVTRYLHGPGIDEPLAMEKAGKVYYYHADGLGSVTALTNMNQKVVRRYKYLNSFGKNIKITKPKWAEEIKQPYAFTGREWDEKTDLYYYRARYHDPKVGRFISRDPIGFAGGYTNLYGYIGNNPVNWLDPWGLWGIDVHSGIGNPNFGTYIWAKQVGFSDEHARIIVIGNNATDDYAGWAIALGVPGRHFDTSIGPVDSRDIFAKFDLQLAFMLYNQGNICGALTTLGRGLHSIQDKVAHGSWPFIIPHPSWFDDPFQRPAALRETEILTKEYLKNFYRRTNR